MLTISQIRDWVANNIRPDQARFVNFDRLGAVAAKIQTYGLGVLSVTAVDRAIRDLALKPLYAKEDPAVELADDAKRRADQTVLDQDLARRLNQMSPAEVAEKYYSNADGGFFRTIYDRACQQWGFRAPAQPSQQSGTSVTPISLTAKEYHSLPAAVVCRRLKEPPFRAAVEKLISEGLI